jgi:hypothetical protein
MAADHRSIRDASPSSRPLAWIWLIPLVLWTFFSWRELVLSPAPRVDERIFLGAIAAVERGESPYAAPVFNYPPPFAVLGARLDRALGEQRFLLSLRLLGVLGASVVAFLAVRRTRWPRSIQLVVAGAIAGFSAPFGAALGQGNVAPFIEGLALAALAWVESAPLLAGVLLGTSVVLKPLAAALVPLLAVYRGSTRPAAPRLAAVVAAGTAVVLLLLLGAQYLAGMLTRGTTIFSSDHNLSLSRIASYVGVELPAGWVFAAVVLLAGGWILRRRPKRLAFDAVATTAAVLSLPMVWPHTLALTFGTQCRALERGFARGRTDRRARLLLVLAIAAVASIDGSAGGGAFPVDWPGPLKSAIATIPLAAMLLLTWLAVREEVAAKPGDEAPAEESFAEGAARL